MWKWVDKLMGVDGYVMKYFVKEQDAFPKDYYC
jgi:hypothetical protein